MKKLFSLALLFASNLAFANCNVDIEANDAMQFTKKEMKVSSSCKTIKVTLKHVGKMAANVMGHNWVLTTTADMQPVAMAGMGAGLAKNYVPEGDQRILAATKVIGGGESTSVEIDMSKLKKGADYTYFCSFPGHWAIMQGKLIVE